MDATTPQLLELTDDHGTRRIAVLNQRGAEPGVLWMQGFMSDMVSTKASALADWADHNGAALTRFDYSGHGQSSGDFEKATISQWLADSLAVYRHCTTGGQILVGSSMGGYLAMLLLRHLKAHNLEDAARIKALVLIAPAWDMTEALMWAQFPDTVRDQIKREGTWLRPSQYGAPYPITRALIEDGRRHLFADAPWQPGVPVRIIHGRLDPDVPYAHSERLMALAQNGLSGATETEPQDIQLFEVPDGEHRLSRPEDIAVLIRTIEALR